jgi:hypothetical protein
MAKMLYDYIHKFGYHDGYALRESFTCFEQMEIDRANLAAWKAAMVKAAEAYKAMISEYETMTMYVAAAVPALGAMLTSFLQDFERTRVRQPRPGDPVRGACVQVSRLSSRSVRALILASSGTTCSLSAPAARGLPRTRTRHRRPLKTSCTCLTLTTSSTCASRRFRCRALSSSERSIVTYVPSAGSAFVPIRSLCNLVSFLG